MTLTPYGDVANVRVISGNIPDTEWPNDEILEQLIDAHSYVLTFLHASESAFTPSDVVYPTLVKMEEELARFWILESYKSADDPQYVMQPVPPGILTTLQSIKDNLPITETVNVDEAILISQSQYNSYGAIVDENRDSLRAIPYRSTDEFLL